jgi:hypothetical protein
VDLTGVTSYYVKESGNDKNSGVSEDAPFKTLAHAIRRAAATPVKTITVIGTLTTACDEIKDIASDGEILITGKADAEAAVVKPEQGLGLDIDGALKIRLERITFTGSGRINAINGTLITLGRGAKVTGITVGYIQGGGVGVYDGSTLVMEEDAEISGNKGGFGGGVFLLAGSQLIMKDNAVIKDNVTSAWVEDGNLRGGLGGGVYMEDGSSLVMQDNALISGNAAYRERKESKTVGGMGGGVNVQKSAITLQDNAAIRNNTASTYGGGVLLSEGTLVMKGKSSIQENKVTGISGINLSLSEIFGDPAPELRGIGSGGGVRTGGNATLTMEDESSISNNVIPAKDFGGGTYTGGGVYLSKEAVFTQNTGTVSGNTAGEESSDIYRAE